MDANAGDGRAVVLPGQLYAYYRWGGTIDPILPTLADKPVATRNAVGYSDLHATDLLWTLDALVQQRRAVPGQLDPLLDLLGARVVVAGADDDRSRSGAAPAAEAADVLDQLGEPDATWGEPRGRARAPSGTLGEPRARRPCARGTGPPRRASSESSPSGPRWSWTARRKGSRRWPRFEDASAGRSPVARLAYAADVAPATIAAAPEVVITDSNRRRVLVPSRLAQNAGPVLAASEEPSVDAAVLNPFPDRGAAAADSARSTTGSRPSPRRPRPGSRSSRRTGRSPRSTGTPPPTGRPTVR